MEFKFCLVGELSVRQKIVGTRFLLDSGVPVVAMDMLNAIAQKLSKKAEKAVVFLPSAFFKGDTFDLSEEARQAGFPDWRILVEGVDFETGMFPKGEE